MLTQLKIKKQTTFNIVIIKSSLQVGVTGFEPATTWSQTRCATGLRYAPPLLCFCGAKIMLFFILCKSDCCAGRYFLSVAGFSAGVRREEYSAGLPKSCAARATAGSKRMP